jgi:hypothetical protein
VEDFSRCFHRSPDRLGPKHIREYQSELFTKRKFAASTVTVYLAALRFFYTKTPRDSRLPKCNFVLHRCLPLPHETTHHIEKTLRASPRSVPARLIAEQICSYGFFGASLRNIFANHLRSRRAE